MQRLQIEVPDMNDSFSRVVLDGTAYLLRFTWSDFGRYWTFGIYTSLQEPIVQGIKIVPQYPLNLQYIDDRLPLGIFAVYTEKERILRDDFNDGTTIFAYVSANQ